MAIVTVLAVQTVIAIVTLLPIETVIAIVTVLAIETDIHGYRDHTCFEIDIHSYQMQGTRSRVASGASSTLISSMRRLPRLSLVF